MGYIKNVFAGAAPENFKFVVMTKAPRKYYGSSLATSDIEVARNSLERNGYVVTATESYGSTRGFWVSLGSMTMRVSFQLKQTDPTRSFVTATRYSRTWIPWRWHSDNLIFLSAICELERFTIGWIDED